MKKGFNYSLQFAYQIALNNIDTMIDYLLNSLNVCPNRLANEINYSFTRAKRRREARDNG